MTTFVQRRPVAKAPAPQPVSAGDQFQASSFDRSFRIGLEQEICALLTATQVRHYCCSPAVDKEEWDLAILTLMISQHYHFLPSATWAMST